MEIDRINQDSSFCYHIACHRTVNSAGKKQHGFAVCSHRHTARTGNDLRINVDLVTDLHIHHDLRIVYIHFCLREGFQELLAQCRIDFHGKHGIVFSRSSRIDLKGIVSFRMCLAHERHHVFCQSLKAFILQPYHRADANDTKHMLQSIHGLIVIVITGTVHKDPCLILVNFKFSVDPFQCVADLTHQGILKEITVFSLDTDLSIFDQKRFIHAVSPLIIISVLRIYEVPEAILSDSPDSNPVLPLSSHCRS